MALKKTEQADDKTYRFGAYELDVPRVELRKNGDPLSIAPLSYRILQFLIEQRSRVVGKGELLDEIWGHRFFSDASLTSQIRSIRKLLADDGQTQRFIRTVRGRGYRFVGEIEEANTTLPRADLKPHPKIRFVNLSDGARLAVGESGTGPVLVKVANWLTHVDKDTDSPIWGHWIEDISAHFRFVRYDARGCGLSDRNLGDAPLNDLDLWVDDLASVTDSLGLQRFSLLALSQGGPVAIAFAARYPNRVSHLILHGTYARGMKRRNDDGQSSQASLQADIARYGWANDDHRFLETFTKQFVPTAGKKERSWFNELQRTSCDAAAAAALEAAMHGVDVSELARSLDVPTLVTHCDDDRAVPFDEGRRLASLIPQSTFLPLACSNHVILADDPAWGRFVTAMTSFIAGSEQT